MSNSSRLHTIVVPWRKFCASLPAVALISGGIVFATQAAPSRDMQSAAASSDSSEIVVPDTALTMPAVPPLAQTNPSATTPPNALALVLPAGTVPGSSASVPLDSEGIPVRALEAYRAAATYVNAADPGCHIDWALLAAIGRVESNHGRWGGNQLDAGGVAQPGIFGIPLDGTNGTARITDTDGGRLDRDSVFDRAVGPMQFIPGTWSSMGVDADGDGVKNPQDMTDAATSTAIYLCSGPGDLRRPGDLTSAIMRYNASDSYVRTVTSIAEAYRNGVTAIPASSMPVAIVAPTATPATPAAVPVAFAARGAVGASGVPVVPVITVAALAGAVVTPTATPTVPSPTTTVADNNSLGTAAAVDTTTATTVSPDPTTAAPDPTTTTVAPDPTTAAPDPTTVPPDPTTTTVAPDPTTVPPDPTTTTVAAAPTTTVPDPCLSVSPSIDTSTPTATICPTPTVTTTAP